MKRLMKIAMVIFSFLAVLSLVLSPFITLVLPGSFSFHTYRRLIDNFIVYRETSSCRTDKEKIEKLFRYVVNHEFMQGTPYSCKPLESLIYAEAYCDFQARTLNVLLAAAGIPSRYAMLLDKNGVSPHTLNEVFLNNKWCVFDTSMNMILKNGRKERFSLDEVSNRFDLLYDCPKLSTLKEYDFEKYMGLIKFYSTVLPFPPIRSTPPLYQAHLFDKIADLYFKIFKKSFFIFYQDLYLELKSKELKNEDFRLFYLARNYHLAYRNDLALKSYQALLAEYPQSKYAEDVLFFRGMLYFEEKKYQQALESFKNIADKHQGKWSEEADYYLGMIYEQIGNDEASLISYNNSDINKLSARILQKLNKAGFHRKTK